MCEVGNKNWFLLNIKSHLLITLQITVGLFNVRWVFTPIITELLFGYFVGLIDTRKWKEILSPFRCL